jgi:hypothetical protein
MGLFYQIQMLRVKMLEYEVLAERGSQIKPPSTWKSLLYISYLDCRENEPGPPQREAGDCPSEA